MSSDVHLGCAALIRTQAQPIPDHLFEPADRRFGSGSFVQRDAFCHATRRCSAMCWRWRSRCVGMVSVVALSTAVAPEAAR
jgi:hypothetical protein